MMKKHYEGKKNPRTERCKFRAVCRGDDETIQSLAVRLREAARHCSFGGNLDEMLVDQFLSGVKSATIVKKVLENSEGLALSFQSAVDIALEVEIGERSSNLYGATPKVQSLGTVNSLQSTKNPREKESNRVRPEQRNQKECYRCKSPWHLAFNCKHKESECRKCGKKGHLAVVCWQNNTRRGAQHTIDEDQESAESVSYEEYSVYTIDNLSDELLNNVDVCLTQSDKKYIVPISVNDTQIDFELDTGAVVSCVSESTYERFRVPGKPLIPTDIKLRDYNKMLLDIAGVALVSVKYEGRCMQLPVVVIRGDRSSLLGRNWMRKIQLDWKNVFNGKSQVHAVQPSKQTVEQLCEEYNEVFAPGLGCLKDFEVSLAIKPEAVPRYKKARPVPYHLRTLVEAELKRLEESGVIKPIPYAEWASPIVPVVKSDGKTVRICADFKETLNPVCDMVQYPLPTSEDIFATLAGGETYSTLDLSNAYHQLKLSEESTKYMVINTHKGLFAYQRLQFGVHSAVGIFQRTMESVLKDIPHCAVYIDDVIVTGPSEAEHLSWRWY